MGRTASTRDYLADAGRGVKLEEQTTEDSTVLKYKSSDGGNRYVTASDNPEGATDKLVISGKITTRGPHTFDNYGTNTPGAFVRITDIEVENEELHAFSISGLGGVYLQGDGFYIHGNPRFVVDGKIEGTSSSTKSNDPLVVAEVRKIIQQTYYFQKTTNPNNITGVKIKQQGVDATAIGSQSAIPVVITSDHDDLPPVSNWYIPIDITTLPTFTVS